MKNINLPDALSKALVIVQACVILSSFPFALAQGLGVSPDSLEISAGEKAKVWISNPNEHMILVFGESDCNGILLEPANVSVQPGSSVPVVVAAPRSALSCNGSLLFSLDSSGSGISIVPSIQIPLIVSSRTASFPVHSIAMPSGMQPSRSVGLLASASTIIVGMIVYFGVGRFGLRQPSGHRNFRKAHRKFRR
ncbi:MAG: hypothetical protein ABIF10_05415 [Candidatus Woesearchaeota archaeon]